MIAGRAGRQDRRTDFFVFADPRTTRAGSGAAGVAANVRSLIKGLAVLNDGWRRDRSSFPQPFWRRWKNPKDCQSGRNPMTLKRVREHLAGSGGRFPNEGDLPLDRSGLTITVMISRQVALLSLVVLRSAACTAYPVATPLPSRESRIPAAAERVTPATDSFPPIVHSDAWEAPSPFPAQSTPRAARTARTSRPTATRSTSSSLPT